MRALKWAACKNELIFACGPLKRPVWENRFFHTGHLSSRMGKWPSIFADATSYGPHGKMMGPRTEKSFFNSVRLTYAKSAYSCNNSIPLFKRELRTVSNCNSIPNLVQLQVMCNRQRTYIQHKLKQYWNRHAMLYKQKSPLGQPGVAQDKQFKSMRDWVCPEGIQTRAVHAWKPK